MKVNLLNLLVIIGIVSCTTQVKKNNIADITAGIDKSSGFVDLILTIIDKKETDSSYVYRAEGLYKSDTVGIDISLRKELKAGIINGEPKNIFVSNGISLKSIGEKSDR
jgi:hypothetical protein